MASVGSAPKVGYQAIAADLIRRIRSGEFMSGAFLPTERELQEEYSTSRTTVRRALAHLTSSSYCEAVPNRGVRVAEVDFTPIDLSVKERKIGFVDGHTYVCHNLFLLLSREARERGYQLVHLARADMSFDDTFEYAIEQELDGILVWPFEGFPNPRIVHAAQSQMAVVCLDHKLRGAETDLVTFNAFEAAREATLKLLQNGRRNIAVTGMLDMLDTTHERFSGYLKALSDYGIGPDSRNFVFSHTSNQRETNSDALINRLQQRDRPDGVFVLQDQFVASAVHATLKCGLIVPSDVAFSTIGDDHEVLVGEAMGSGIRIDWEQMCLTGLSMIEERWDNPYLPARTKVVPHTFIDRGLAGTPRHAWTEITNSVSPYALIERKYPKPRFFYVIPAGSSTNLDRELISLERES